MKSGYWQIAMDQKDRHKTAIWFRSKLYEFVDMPFGLATAPSTFMQAMEITLAGLINKICTVYLDDILIFSNSIDEHILHVELVIQALNKQGWKISIDKCRCA